MKAHGNVVDHEYEIERDGETVATSSRSGFCVRESYGVDVTAGEDAALILATSTVAIRPADDPGLDGRGSGLGLDDLSRTSSVRRSGGRPEGGGHGILVPCPSHPSCSQRRRCSDSWTSAAGSRLWPVPYFDGLLAGIPTRWSSRSPASRRCTTRSADGSRARRVPGVRHRDQRLAPAARRLRRRRRARHPRARGFEEVVLHLDTDGGTRRPPVAVVADRRPDGRIDELRVYFSSWPLTGRHANRPPPAPARPRAARAGRRGRRTCGRSRPATSTRSSRPSSRTAMPASQPAASCIHRGPDGLRAFYERLFSNGGGIPLETCALVDDGRACALEYNVVRPG